MKQSEDGKVFLSAFTDMAHYSLNGRFKGEQFAVIDFEGLVTIFEKQQKMDFLWLNPASDSAQINRSIFTPTRVIQKNTQIQIGLPESKPNALIDFLILCAEKNTEITAIYLGLIRCNSEFSYAVFIESEDTEKVVAEIGPRINELNGKDELLYPVDFMYDNFLKEEKYLIYRR